MNKIIETSKGRFEVVKAIDNTNIHTGLKLSEITEEEEASEIVDYIPFNYIDKEYKLYRDYKLPVGNYCGRTTALESLHSLLKHHNIEITNNTYIFKL